MGLESINVATWLLLRPFVTINHVGKVLNIRWQLLIQMHAEYVKFESIFAVDREITALCHSAFIIESVLIKMTEILFCQTEC